MTDLHEERARTLAQIESLTRDFDSVVESIEGVGNDDEHDPDGSTIAFERAQVLALLRVAKQHLVELDAAEARQADGTYGTCERCAGPIGDARLEALPTTTYCVGCAS